MEQNFKGAMIMMHLVLPGMKERKKGCIINIASRLFSFGMSVNRGRAGTVTGPLAVHYYSGKAALIRATGCIQVELDLLGFNDVHLYALHPGGCKTGLQSQIPYSFFLADGLEPLDKDVAEEFPSIAQGFEDFQKTFCVSLDVPGQTCVYIASGKAKHALKGKYFDCEQNIQTVVDHAAEIQKDGLYELEVRFLGGLPNDGGTAKFQ